MAGYSTINAQFRPMSYQEMLAPVAAATQEQQNIEELQAQLQALSGQWKEKLNREAPDSKARTLYNNYIQELQNQSDELSMNGLTPGARKNLAGLKARYSSDILPIEEAYKLKQQKVAEDEALKKQGYLVNKDMSKLGIDEYINNPYITNESYQSALITQRVANAVKPIAEKFANNRSMQHINPQYFEYVKHYGATQGTIEALRHGVIKGEIGQQLQSALQGVINSTGISNWKNNEGTLNIDALNKALEYGFEGLGASVGKDDASLAKDDNFLNALQRAQLKQYLPPETPTSYASTHSYFDINKHDSDFSSIKNKLFKNNYNTALASLFGKDGANNPMKTYETATRQLSEQGITDYNNKVKALAIKYGLDPNIKVEKLNDGRFTIVNRNKNGIVGSLTGNLAKEWIALQTEERNNVKNAKTLLNNISENEYNALKVAGVTSKDNLSTIKLKMSNYESAQSRIYTGYDLGITNYDYVDKQLDRTITQSGSKALTPLDDKFNNASKYGTGSRTGRLWRGDDFKYEDDIKGKISGIEYVPKAGGLVLFTNDGGRYLVNQGAIKDLVDFIIKNNKTINTLINKGNEVISHTADGKEITGYQYALELIRDNLNAVIPLLTHSENPTQPLTSPNPFGFGKQ